MNRHLAARPYARDATSRAWTAIMIVAIHAIPLSALIIGTDRSDWLLFAAIYPIQGVLGVSIGLHRYFAHKSFITSRPFQFLLALAATSTFGNPVRFAGKHRLHHQHADRKDDPHTPVHGFWWCWFGSHLDCKYNEDEILARVPDLLQYPELRWLYRFWLAPGLILCTSLFLVGGYSAMAIGALLGPVLLLHQTTAINFFCHKYGRRRFATHDNSTNNLIVAIVLAGEGWHNNHHRYPYSARTGFLWWEVDLIYCVIRALEIFGLVWDVRQPPDHVRRNIPAQNLKATSRQ